MALSHVFWNVVYELRPRSIGNRIKWVWQYCTRGFSDRQTWNLNDSLCKWLLPRLKVFIANDTTSYPCSLYHSDSDEWDDELGKEAHKKWLEILSNIEYFVESAANNPYSKEDERYELGKKQFFEYFENLWD